MAPHPWFKRQQVQFVQTTLVIMQDSAVTQRDAADA